MAAVQSSADADADADADASSAYTRATHRLPAPINTTIPLR